MLRLRLAVLAASLAALALAAPSSSAQGQKITIGVSQAADGTWIGNFEMMYALKLIGKMRDAKPGEIITLYGTGFGAATPATPPDSVVTQPAKLAAPVTFLFGRTVAEVVWAGQIGSGVYQFNIKVPDVASGDHVVVAEIGGHRSQGNAVISVQHQ